MILEREDAIQAWRDWIEKEEGELSSELSNAVHGSDSITNAEREIDLMFNQFIPKSTMEQPTNAENIGDKKDQRLNALEETPNGDIDAKNDVDQEQSDKCIQEEKYVPAPIPNVIHEEKRKKLTEIATGKEDGQVGKHSDKIKKLDIKGKETSEKKLPRISSGDGKSRPQQSGAKQSVQRTVPCERKKVASALAPVNRKPVVKTSSMATVIDGTSRRVVSKPEKELHVSRLAPRAAIAKEKTKVTSKNVLSRLTAPTVASAKKQANTDTLRKPTITARPTHDSTFRQEAMRSLAHNPKPRIKVVTDPIAPKLPTNFETKLSRYNYPRPLKAATKPKAKPSTEACGENAKGKIDIDTTRSNGLTTIARKLDIKSTGKSTKPNTT
ncbi:hypothetical protein EC973_001825 [Apophysomyces ossiformis]|uniref:Uncharacterized protein n=1 Tax=Apophysomyces ossiformis TaxID=679940 RepID=A0A8H7BPK8_9FUNG|nr:hypothetical protein EC973_001825 [Apophysomyces ossiformis]